MIETYISKIASTTKQGDAREESYYSALAELLEVFSKTKRNKIVHVTILPKKTEAGNPDFRVWDGKHSQVGYVECKPPQANLDHIETSDQLKRYLSTFPNLILTNFYEFRLYRNGLRVDTVLLARPFIPAQLKTIPPAEHITEFLALLEKFFQFTLPAKFTAESLANELATRTRFLRDQVIKEELYEAKSEGAKKILGFYDAFKKYLIANLSLDEFADLYAQTVTYGLFAARTRANGVFNRKLAYDLIPKTIGILREIFHFISFDPPEQMQATVDDIAEVLAVADVKNILRQYFKEGKGSDPIFHFYETFLAEYNPQERERRGVYYTPEPVVSYIVRSLNIILKQTFSQEDGFATHTVTVLDPAGGTLTFLAEAAKLAIHEFVSKYGGGSKSKFIEDHILQHYFAFEIMMAPYAAGHLKMGYLLEELGHKISGDERFQFYLTNTLDMEELDQTSLPGMASLSEESHLAGNVKKEKPILVILGNPPYSGQSTNKGKWIIDQIKNYKIVDGKPLGEKNPKWLQDDYVKFIRFAQWKIDQVGVGVLGFITNHSYLDNPTFRGMRQSLMKSFDEIYILDLHGNSLKKEKAPDGSKDENVFDIQQGVAIALFIKRKSSTNGKVIKHGELWGLRDHKYEWLRKHDYIKTEWSDLKPSSPLYLFVPREEKLQRRFQLYPSIQALFPINSVGIVTARDHLTIHWSSHDVWTTVLNFSTLDSETARRAYKLGNDAQDWNVKSAQDDLKKSGPNKTNIVPVLYRPFDIRFTYYTGNSKGFHCRPRGEVMKFMLQSNCAIVLPRRVETAIPWSHVFATDQIVEHVAVSLKTIDYCFPLYIYPDSTKNDLFSQHKLNERLPNLSPQLIEVLESAYDIQPSPEDVFNYIYCILYSNGYRKKYAEFLKTDFPHVPFTKDYKLFKRLVEKGAYLIELHLLKSKELVKPLAKCEGSGDLRVVKISYNNKKQRIYINSDKYFASIPIEVWEYHIGGYQVAEKWLKDRKGRTLSSEEVVLYTKIITSISKTIEIQELLDDLFEKVESSILKISL